MDNPNYKSGFVALIGRPNVGKSTFLNYVVGQKVAIMSNVAQTTRNKIQGIYTTNDAQIVFIDTPGYCTWFQLLRIVAREMTLSLTG